MLADVARLARFSRAYWRLLDVPLTPEVARPLIAARLAEREVGFLECVAGILDQPQSPYGRLFAHAGLEYGDVAALVRQLGLEGALGRLYDAGIYTTTAELKGEAPIRRGSLELAVSYLDFVNPLVAGHGVVRSGGSGGRARTHLVNIETQVAAAQYVAVVSDGYGMRSRPMALWYPSPPGAAGLGVGLQHVQAGFRIERWFAQTPWLQRGLASSAATTIAAATISKLRRSPLAFPRYTPPEEAARVARWAADRKAAGTPAYLGSTPSSAVRVCHAAAAAGLDVAGTMFRCGGEPLTAAKAAAIAAVGGLSSAYYFAAETSGLIAAPCPEGEAPDDAHLAEDKLALVVRPHPLPHGGTVDSLLFTMLMPRSRQLIVNWESGDTAVVRRRSCGCPLGALGLETHLHSIHSYEKLTSEGMTFADGALVTLVEEVLPRRFGGRPTDYQVVEQEVDGSTRVRLRVSPALGTLDEPAVVEEALRYLSERGGPERAMAAVWRGAGTIEVVRVEPHVTAASKTPALYRERR